MYKVFLCLFFFGHYCFAANPNHSELEKGHDHTAEEFVSDVFLNETGNYDIVKASSFVDRLLQERKALKHDLFGTKFIEEVELELKSFEKAKKNAIKEVKKKKNNLLYAYDKKLIPLAEKILKAIEGNAPIEKINSDIDELIELYAVFYLPNAPRSFFHMDQNIWAIAKNLNGYKFSKSIQYLEANNLKVGKEYKDEVSSCLGDVSSKHILTNNELGQLKDCGFDLSKLNPVKNPFWSNLDKKEKEKRRNLRLELFPDENDEIIFKEIKYSSAGSPKLKGEFIDKEGNKRSVKIKFAHEVHTEPVSTMLAKLIGFNQDHVLYKEEVKLYLEDDEDVDAVITQWKRKYKGLRQDISNYIKARSAPEDKKQWVVFRNALLESKDPKRKRLESFHPWGWDLPNRREHRAKVLWFGFLNLIDTKAGNHRVYLEEAKKGDEVKYSLQDIGYSLQTGLDLRNIYHGIKWSRNWGVNTYRPTFLSWNSKHVHIHWAEVLLNKSMFTTTTFNDLKWFARKIARLTEDDYRYAFSLSGLPEDMQELYVYKILSRRNEVVQAFDLEDEFDLFSVPELNSYSPTEDIENGVYIRSNYENGTLLMNRRFRFEPIIADVLGGLFKLDWIRNNISAQISSSLSLEFDKLKNVLNPKTFKEFTFSGVQAGVKIQVNRYVDHNNQYISYKPDQSHAFVVRDKLKISFDLNSEIGKVIKNNFPLLINLKTQIFEREFEHIHFSNSWQEGYRSPFELLRLILTRKDKLPYYLTKNEIFKVQDAHGIGVSATLQYNIQGVNLDMTQDFSVVKSKPLFFGRDAMGEFFILDDDIYKRESRFSVSLGSLNLIIKKVPLLDLSFSRMNLKYKSRYYTLGLKDYDLFSEESLNTIRRAEDSAAIHRIMNYPDSDPVKKSLLKVSVDGEGVKKNTNIEALVLFNSNKAQGHSIVKVRTRGEEEEFSRFYMRSESFLGRDDILNILESGKMTVFKESGARLTVEANLKDIEKGMALVEYSSYRRKLSAKDLGVYLSDLNEKFQENKSTSFFRELTPVERKHKEGYLKVYSHVRVYIDLKRTLKKIKEMTRSEFSAFLRANALRRYKRNSASSRPVRNPQYWRLMESFQVLKQWNPELSNTFFTKHMGQVLSPIILREKGLEKYREFFGDKGLLVFGEVYGVHPSISTMQQAEAVAGRRFTSHVWGEVKNSPPMRKFLKKNLLGPLSTYAGNESYINYLFGALPSVSTHEYF